MSTGRLSSEGRERLVTRVARMYHQRGLNQPQIAEQLHVSQAKVSRLLKLAEELGIVRVEVIAPPGDSSAMEERLVSEYGLVDAVIANTTGTNETENREAIGAAAAAYLRDTLLSHERIGVSPWSATLLSTVTNLERFPRPVADCVVQVVGGESGSLTQIQATKVTDELARLSGGTPIFLNSPAIVTQKGLGSAILREPNVEKVAAEWNYLTVLIAGIRAFDATASPQPNDRLSLDQQILLCKMGAVGGICLRYFDADGNPVSICDDQIIGIDRTTLLKVPRRIAVAGGLHKAAAIYGALKGGWANILVTDLDTAEFLLTHK